MEKTLSAFSLYLFSFFVLGLSPSSPRRLGVIGVLRVLLSLVTSPDSPLPDVSERLWALTDAADSFDFRECDTVPNDLEGVKKPLLDVAVETVFVLLDCGVPRIELEANDEGGGGGGGDLGRRN